MHQIIDIVKEGLFGGINSVFKIALVVFPLMIILEIARDLNLLQRFAKLCRPITEFIGISEESSFPLAIGMIFGLAYGAGIIIQSAKDGNLDKKNLILVIIFLVCCHAVIEDTLLFVAVGANGILLLTIRLVTAFIITYIISKKVMSQKSNDITIIEDKVD